MSAPAVHQPVVGVGHHRTAMALLGAAVVLLIAEAVGSVVAGAVQDIASFVTLQLALIALIAAGAVLIRDKRHIGLGALLLWIAVAGALWNLTSVRPSFGPSAFVNGFLYWAYAGAIVHLVLRWPDRRIEGRIARLLVVALYTLMPVLTALWELTWRPRWFGGDAAEFWWVTFLPARDFSASTWQAQQLLFITIVAAAVGIVAARTVAGRGARRIVLLPVAIVAVLLAGTVVLQIVQALGAEIPISVDVVQNVGLLAIPIAVLVAAARRPAAIDREGMPGRRRLGEEDARTRYRFGIAGIVAGLVVIVIVLVAVAAGSQQGAVPVPAPGPAVAAS